MAQEWLCLDNTWYYLGTDGAMRTGWQYLGGTWYFLQSNGTMVQNWLYQNGTWYYLGIDGAMKTGWQLVGDTWYFLQSSGAMARNWIYLNGTWYYLGADGAMQIDWQYVGGAWYYLEQDGHMAIGWKKINNVWYYLNGSGKMVITPAHDDKAELFRQLFDQKQEKFPDRLFFYKMEIVYNQIDIPRLTLQTVKQDLKKQRSRRISTLGIPISTNSCLSFGKFRKLRQKLLQKILPASANMFRRNISADSQFPLKSW